MKAMINNCISFMSALLAACCLPQQTLTKHTPVWSISPLTSTNIAYVVSLVTSQKLESGTEALIILLSCTLPGVYYVSPCTNLTLSITQPHQRQTLVIPYVGMAQKQVGSSNGC